MGAFHGKSASNERLLLRVLRCETGQNNPNVGKTRLSNLVRHKRSGGYYARAYANGKEVWILRTPFYMCDQSPRSLKAILSSSRKRSTHSLEKLEVSCVSRMGNSWSNGSSLPLRAGPPQGHQENWSRDRFRHRKRGRAFSVTLCVSRNPAFSRERA